MRFKCQTVFTIGDVIGLLEKPVKEKLIDMLASEASGARVCVLMLHSGNSSRLSLLPVIILMARLSAQRAKPWEI